MKSFAKSSNENTDFGLTRFINEESLFHPFQGMNTKFEHHKYKSYDLKQRNETVPKVVYIYHFW